MQYMFTNQKIIPEHERVYHYVTGEQHKYLGKFYTLWIVPTCGNEEPFVEIINDKMLLHTDRPQDAKKSAFLIDMWYRERAREIFVPIMADAVVKAAPYKVQMPRLRIYRMLTRWGSCSPKSKILILNLELIKVPVKCIEYVALHEMLHYRYPSHNMAFYAALGNLMPDWRDRENLLNDRYPI